MSGLLDKLSMTKSDGMSGIGPDQGALNESDSPSINPTNSGTREQSELGVGSGDGKGLDRAPNSFGGPSFGRTSKTTSHKSETLNKLDPRIGYDDDDVRQQELERYESEYGKPEDFSDVQLNVRNMSGIGADQSALRENPAFRAQEENTTVRHPSDG
ncbi:hypothetical protein A1O3_02167 [Capronia epimyces CBS 606.96]|uniref:Uncharacterized protein n=1 Tax=Capronia epimyces CBS 606.96 TaxID=1182542 RepID=W9Y988_9EURO|nr:uncharacterized protein A1O3_02167 [Capronia epimyces CBS 606.96]EXJ89103.1 hypothetical protein A1O3_02167 [Capronia epimyces CBS 606.96]